jgi:hypothetical protein
MVSIRLSVIIGKDRRLVVDLPDDMPLGPAELEIHPVPNDHTQEYEEIKVRLSAAGLLVAPTAEELGISVNVVPLTLEERMRIGQMPPDAPPVEELVDEDRGEW